MMKVPQSGTTRSPIAFAIVLVTFGATQFASNTVIPDQRRVKFVGGDRSPICRVDSGARLPTTPEGDLLVTTCSADEKIRCDGSRIEPVDVSIAAACQSGIVELVGGETITILGSRNRPVTIEWLSGEMSGLSVVARREFPSEQSFTITVNRADRRFIRFTRFAAAPLTIPAVALSSPFSLPTVRPGGELVVSVPEGELSPTEVTVRASRVFRSPDRNNVAIFSGIPPGRYSIAPTYQSRAGRAVSSATVEGGRSSHVFLHPDSVGAVTVKAPGALCKMNMRWPLTHQSDRSAKQIATLSSPPPGCTWFVAGLVEGQYRAELRSEAGIEAAGTVTASLGRSVALELAAATVDIQGRLSYNGRLMANTPVSVSSADGSESETTTTSSDGSFHLRLMRPGSHALSAGGQGGKRIPQSKVFVTTQGKQSIHWNIVGGDLELTVEGGLPERTKRVEIHGPLGVVRAELPSGQRYMSQEGLEAGAYRVSVYEDGQLGHVSERIIDAVVTAGERTAVTAVLVRNSSRVFLQGPNGERIENADVFRGGLSASEALDLRRAGRPSLTPAAQNGVVELWSFPPGTEVIVVPPSPYAPACMRVSLDQQSVLRFDVGQKIEVRGTGLSSLSPLAGGVRTDGELGCPIPLWRFDHRLIRREADGVVIGISNFLSGSRVYWERTVPTPTHAVLTVDKGRLVLPTFRQR